METTTEIDPKNILDQDTESEDHETTVTSETLRTSPKFYRERELPADQETVGRSYSWHLSNIISVTQRPWSDRVGKIGKLTVKKLDY